MSYRPSDIFSAETAGFYDGDKVVISADHLLNSAVLHHEHVHQLICTTCADGFIFELLAKLNRSDKLSQSARVRVNGCLQSVLDSQRFPQECFATYMGMQQLREADISKSVSDLPQEYKEYYLCLADVLDLNISTTYARYAVGLGISQLVFSSPLLARIQRGDLLESKNRFRISEEESPLIRLKKVLGVNGISQKIRELNDIILKKASQICVAGGASRANFDTDSNWSESIGISPDVAFLVDDSVRESAFQFFAEITNLPWLNEDECWTHMRRVGNAFADIIPFAEFSDAVAPKLVRYIRTQDEMVMYRQLRQVIVNYPLKIGIDFEASRRVSSRMQLEEECWLIPSKTDAREGYWYLVPSVRDMDEQKADIDFLDSTTGMTLLYALTRQVLPSEIIAKTVNVLLPTYAPPKKIVETEKCPPHIVIFYYMFGNLVDYLSQATTNQIKWGMIQLGSHGVPRANDQLGGSRINNDAVVVVVSIHGIPGIGLRLISASLVLPLVFILKHKANADCVQEMSREELDSALSGSEQAISLAISFWEYL